MSNKILVVDDETEIADLIEVYLKNENYTVFKFYTAQEALNCIETTPIDLAILDIMLPDIDGYAFTLFGDKESPENYQENDTTTQGPDDVQGGLSDESSPQNTQTANDDTDWNLVLVNYENAIPENYEPKLVEVPGGEKVDERIYDPLMEMLEAAKEGNWDQLPMVVSGYRTQKKQQQLYDDKVAGYRKEGNSQSEAEELAKQWVSVPGYSEHQIGLAVDINGATYDLYFWLQENSYKYGFIYRYPGDKTDITGVAEEVWHYRYVGVEAATEMYEKGLCLEEYLAERQAEQ